MRVWITDRRPTGIDGIYVFDQHGILRPIREIADGEPWMHIVSPGPYVKPKTWEIMTPADQSYVHGPYAVYLHIGGLVADKIPTREAAEHIAAIYEEAIP